MSNIGWVELLIIVGVIVVLFLVPKKLPQLVRSVRRSIRNLRKRRKEGKGEIQSTVDEVKDSAGVEDLKSTAEDTRETADSKGVLPGEDESSATSSPGADQDTKSE